MYHGNGNDLTTKQVKLVNKIEDITFDLQQFPSCYLTVGENYFLLRFLLTDRFPTVHDLAYFKELKTRCIKRQKEEDRSRESINKALKELDNRSSY